MFERGISVSDVEAALDSMETIEEYPDDQPLPSKLILGRAGGRAIHVVLADDLTVNERIIITVYEPDPSQWESDLRTRKR